MAIKQAGLHIVATVAENVCNYVPMRILKLPKYLLKVSVVNNQYSRPLQQDRGHAILGQLKKTSSQTCACDLHDLYGDQAL